MSKETELSDEQIDGCWDGLMPSGNGKSRYDIARAVIAADRELRRGDAGMPVVAERLVGWVAHDDSTNKKYNKYELVKLVRLADAQAALAAQAVEIDGLRKDAERYRWLRTQEGQKSPNPERSELMHCICVDYWTGSLGKTLSGERLDSVVDSFIAAIAQEKAK